MAAPNKKINRGIIWHILTPFCIAEGNSGKQFTAGTVQRFLRELSCVCATSIALLNANEWVQLMKLWKHSRKGRAFFDIWVCQKFFLTQYDQTKIRKYYTIYFQKCHKVFFLWRQFHWCQSFENKVNAFVWCLSKGFCSIFESIQCLWNSWRPKTVPLSQTALFCRF